MSASSARGHYANPPLEDEDDLIDPDDGKFMRRIHGASSLREVLICALSN
jgi:hypothetical protein